MKNALNLRGMSTSISHFFHRYHVILFVIFVIGGLATATFFLSRTLNNTATRTTADPTQSGCDSTTIKKIGTLRGANDPSTPLAMPSGRTNPFQ